MGEGVVKKNYGRGGGGGGGGVCVGFDQSMISSILKFPHPLILHEESKNLSVYSVNAS